MNWLDWVFVAVLGFAVVRGFMRGLVVELCALVGIVLGLWAAVHFNARVAEWIGLDTDQEVLAFVATFFLVLLGINLLGRAITKALEIAQLSLPNKLMGTLFGMVRAAFLLSVLLNIGLANEANLPIPDHRTRNESVLYAPLRAFAPVLVPALEDTKWMRRGWEALRLRDREEAERATESDTLEAQP
jgi:membrane protein required for colicin V production